MPSTTPQWCPVEVSHGFFTGTDKGLRFTVLDSASAAVNILGWSLSWQLKRRKSDSDLSALITKTTDDDITITDAANGKAVVALVDTETDTEVLGNKDYWHELKRTDDGFEEVLAHGPFTISTSLHKA